MEASPGRQSPFPVLPRYEILSLIGEGGVARVYQARYRDLGRLVAVKTLKEDLNSSPVLRERFLREARIVAALPHPNIVALHDVGEADQTLFLVMELLEGGTLADTIRNARAPLKRHVAILERVARALGAVHERGIVHRDLKPGNILLTRDGEPKIGDFGLAHVSGAHTKLTRTGAAMGTPLYMAPEQIEGDPRKIGPRTDVYALGAILYEMLVGRPPHETGQITEIYARILGRDPVEPRKVNPRVPRELEAICLKALEKAPLRRYRDAASFADDLRRWLDGEAVSATPVTTMRRWARKAARNKSMAVALSLLVTVLAGAAAVVMVQAVRHGRREAALQRLATLGSAVVERKRDLRQLKVAAPTARRDLEEAVRAVAPYIADWPDEPQGYYVRARGRLYLGDLEGAEQDAREALARSADFEPAWTLLGMILIEKYQELARGVTYQHEKRQKAFEPVLRDALAAFERGLPPDRDPRAAQQRWGRWGIVWTREDSVNERLAAAFHLRHVKKAPDDARRLLEDAITGYRAEEYSHWLGAWARTREEATRRFDEAVEWGPGYLTGRLSRSYHRERFDDVDGALSDAACAVELDPTSALAISRRGELRRRKGDTEGALKDLNRAVELSPRNAMYYNNRALTRSQLNDAGGALEDYGRAIELDPTLAEPCINRAENHRRAGRMKEALADFSRAIEARPDHDSSYFERGGLRSEAGDTAGAIADYSKAIELNPRRALAWYNRGVARERSGALDGALEDYSRAIEIDPSYSASWVNRGTVKARKKDFAGAIDDYTHAIGLKPDHDAVYSSRGNARRRLGDVEGALEDLDRALALNPGLTDGWLNRGLARNDKRDFGGAASDWERFLELAPGDPMADEIRAAIREARAKASR